MKHLRRGLRMRRAALDLSQRVTAKRARVAFQRYWDIENELRDPSPGELGRIARALRTTPDALLAGVPAALAG